MGSGLDGTRRIRPGFFSYITPSFRPQMARYASRFTRYELCSLLVQSMPRTPSRLKTSMISVNPVILSNFSSCLRVFVAKTPRNLRNPRLINDLRACKALYICRETSTDIESSLQIRLFMQNKAKFRKSQMNASPVITKEYEKRTLGQRGKKQSQTNPNKANYKKAKMNVTSILTVGYENKPPIRAPKKQTQYKPNQSQYKAN